MTTYTLYFDQYEQNFMQNYLAGNSALIAGKI